MKKSLLIGILGLVTLVSLIPQSFAEFKTDGCTSTQSTDLKAMATYVSNNWAEFEDYIDRNYDINLKGCIENRFKSNGTVVCEDSCDAGVNGWASYLSQKAHFCPSFLNRVGNMSKVVDRRTCYFALAAHEFGHTCFRGHGTVEDIDNGAFDWYKLTHPGVTIDLINCGMD